MNTAENIAYNILHKNGYIYAQTVQSAKSDLKKFVLSDKGYVTLESGFKIKSRIVPAYFWVRNESGKRVKVLSNKSRWSFTARIMLKGQGMNEK